MTTRKPKYVDVIQLKKDSKKLQFIVSSTRQLKEEMRKSCPELTHKIIDVFSYVAGQRGTVSIPEIGEISHISRMFPYDGQQSNENQNSETQTESNFTDNHAQNEPVSVSDTVTEPHDQSRSWYE